MFDGMLLKEKIREGGYTTKTLAFLMGINYVTLYRKVNGDSEFTRNEICSMINILNLSDDEVKEIFFSEV